MTRFLILCKRQLTHPVFVLLCLLLPVSCLFIRNLKQNSRSSLMVGLYAEAADSFTEAVCSELAGNGSIRFEIFDDKASMLEKTASNTLDCAYVFDAGLHVRLLEMDYKNCITCYVSPSTIMDKLSREVVFSALFRQLGGDIALSCAEEAGITKGSPDSQAIAGLYQRYLEGDDVFSLNYQYLNTLDSQAEDTAPSAAVMPVRGFIAVLLLVAGLCGGISWMSDRERLLPVSASCSILIPLLFMSVSACLTLGLTGEAGSWIWEIISLFLYLLLILVFVQILLLVIRKPGTMAAMVPILTIGSLIFCPIFINLGTLLPLFRITEKLFLPYYYLTLTAAL